MTEFRAENCPLCAHPAPERVLCKADREYRRCKGCQLYFVPRTQHLNGPAAADYYRQHENDPADANYRAFLDRLLQHLHPRLAAGMEGLDYGSGPGPTISVMLAELGFCVANYDPIFAPDAAALQRQYDFITCTETVEHFAQPAEDFARFDALLRPGGWLGVMTLMQEDDAAFPTWWYLKDPTHVSFYRAATMQWIARRFEWSCEFPAPNITLFQKRADKIPA